MYKRFEKKDVIFIGILFAVCLIIFLVFNIFPKNGSLIVITRDGEEYISCSLQKNQKIQIKDKNGKVTNTLVIENKKAYMESADCPDRLCVQQKAIFHEHENIVCLPNKIVVTVTQGEASDYDAIAQ